MQLTDALPVLATVALFRSQLHGFILVEMARFNQSKHVFNVPDWCFSLVSCPLCLGLHFAWIYVLFTDACGFLSLHTAGYVLTCSLASFALHNTLSIVVHASNVLELQEAMLINKLPKSIAQPNEEPASAETPNGDTL